MIWDAQPWRDSLCLVSMAYDATKFATGNQWLVFPSGVERVLKLRTADDITLSPLESVSVFDFNNQLWESVAQPVSFSVFPPVVMGPCQNGTGDFIADGGGSTNDAGLGMMLIGEKADGTNFRGVSAIDVDGEITDAANSYLFVQSLSFAAGVKGTHQLEFVSFPAVFTPIAIGETQVPRVPRIRVHGSLSTSIYLAMCKRASVGMVNDGDSSEITGIDNALLDFTQADMLERARQYGKSQAKIQAANTQLGVAYSLERDQTADERRIIPVVTQGPWWTYSHSLSKTNW